MPTPERENRWNRLWVLLWLVLVPTAILARPPLPIDETRYLSVAWEMWHGSHFLVPHINGLPYSHKPPLLFWMIQLGWLLFGVNAYSARLTAPFFGLLCLPLAARMARRLWPTREPVARLAPFVLLAMPLWAVFGTLTMFDMPLAFFTLLGAFGFVSADEGKRWSGWSLAAIAMGAGILTKGPVVLLHLLPLGLLAPWWTEKRPGWPGYGKWCAALLAATVAATAIALAWALPAARAGGPAYADAILWRQTAGRVVKSFAHNRPVWWYLVLLPAVLFPWIFEKRLWRAMRSLRLDRGTRFCLSWALPPLVLLSVVSGKQIHYLIPLLPPSALLISRRLSNVSWPSAGYRLWHVGLLFLLSGVALAVLPLITVDAGDLPSIGAGLVSWGTLLAGIGVVLLLWKARSVGGSVAASCAAVVLFVCLMHIGPLRHVETAFAVSPVARRIAELQRAGRDVAVWPSKYAGQFQFAGRLTHPLAAPITRPALQQWIKRHRHGGYVVLIGRPKVQAGHRAAPVYDQPFMGERITLWQAVILERAPEVLNQV